MSVAGEQRIAAAFAGCGKRAALMPYLMGGYPDLDTSRRIGEAAAAAGADMLELGIPFSDPLADGPVIHDAATHALSGGASVATASGAEGPRKLSSVTLVVRTRNGYRPTEG